MISIIIPTYKEAENLPALIPRIYNALNSANLDCEIIIVDDDSPDNTAEVAKELAINFPVRTIVRKDERGLSGAVMTGFNSAKGDICVVMDADLSHPPEKIPELIFPILRAESQITVGSRYIEGGGSSDWSDLRLLMSRISGFLACGITKLSDPTSGFMAVKKSVLDQTELRPIGWKIVLETVTRSDAKVKEIPFIFADRYRGESKLNYKVQLQYLQHLFQLYEFRLPVIVQFVKFCLVGISGLIIDTAVLVTLVELFSFDPRFAAIFSFTGAIVWNYYLDRNWTFNYGLCNPPPLPRFCLFFAVCVFGLGVRLLAMHLLLTLFSSRIRFFYIFANFTGIIISTFSNFIGSRRFVFKKM